MLIADSALAVVGASGLRALSHAAVDTQAGLPKGSTSYYCRKRIDLLRLTLRRLIDLDQLELQAAADEMIAASPLTPDRVADVVAGVVERWLTGERRAFTRARFELFLAVAHEEELKEVNREHILTVLTIARRVAESIEPPKAREHVATTLMLADGLMVNVLRQDIPSPSRTDIARLLLVAIGAPITPSTPAETDFEVLRTAWESPPRA